MSLKPISLATFVCTCCGSTDVSGTGEKCYFNPATESWELSDNCDVYDIQCNDCDQAECIRAHPPAEDFIIGSTPHLQAWDAEQGTWRWIEKVVMKNVSYADSPTLCEFEAAQAVIAAIGSHSVRLS